MLEMACEASDADLLDVRHSLGLIHTGHSITMPGICGAFINAFDMCDLLCEDSVFFDAIAS